MIDVLNLVVQCGGLLLIFLIYLHVRRIRKIAEQHDIISRG